MRDAMKEGGKQERASEALLAASLHVDGAPVDLEALLDLPGRYAGDIGRALTKCHEMHGLIGSPSDEDEDGPKQ